MPVRYYQEIDDDTSTSGAQLRREISITTISDAVTLPDNRGAGRTLDKVFVWGGERLERAVTWVLSRAGRGPRSSMKEIMRAIYESSTTPGACGAGPWSPSCGYWGPPSQMTAPPTTYELPIICKWLAYAAHTPRCPKCGRSMTEQGILIPLKSSKKLVKLISATNKSSCYMSLQLLTLLVTIFPDSRELFADMGAWDILHEVSERMSGQLDVDSLLAPSRRALVSLSDAEILSLGKVLEVPGAMDFYGLRNHEPFTYVVSKLIDCFSHPEKRLLALTVAHQFPRLLWSHWHPVLNIIYPLLFIQLASSNDPVEVAVLADSFYRIIDRASIITLTWLIKMIKTRSQLLENIPDQLCSLIDSLPARYEQDSIDQEEYWGRRVDWWRRMIWRYDPDDPEGEPDDDWKLYKEAARDDGEYGEVKIDAVWWEVPVWVTCDRRKRRLEGREEQGKEDREWRGWDGHRGRRPRTQSITRTAWPDWMKARQHNEAEEWQKYWKGAEFVNFTGWSRQVGTWLKREPYLRYRGNRDWQIFWTKLSTRMRSRSVD